MARRKKSDNVLDLQANMKLRLNGQIIDLQDVMEYIASRPAPTIIKRDIKGKPIVVREYENAMEAHNKLSNILDAVVDAFNSNQPKRSGSDDAVIRIFGKGPIGGSFCAIERFIDALTKDVKYAEELVNEKRKAYEESNFYVALPAV